MNEKLINEDIFTAQIEESIFLASILENLKDAIISISLQGIIDCIFQRN